MKFQLVEVSDDGKEVVFRHNAIISVLPSKLCEYHPDEQRFIKAYQAREFTKPSLTNATGIFKDMSQAQICRAVLPAPSLEVEDLFATNA